MYENYDRKAIQEQLKEFKTAEWRARQKLKKKQVTKEQLAAVNLSELSEYERERFSFLNTSKKIMHNGVATASQPHPVTSQMQIRLYESIKDRMNSDHHRKI